MKTPYDPAIRIGKRALESIRVSLRAEIVRITELDDEAAGIAYQKMHEYEAAEGDWTISTYEWLRARQTRMRNITQDKIQAEDAMGRLRNEATQAYGQLQAIESTAAAWAQHARQRAHRKTQAEVDDLASARLLLKRRRAAKRTARYG